MSTIASLWKILDDSRKRSVTGQYFLTRSDIENVFTQDIVAVSVAELPIAEHDRIGLAAAIFDRGLTIFAILIWMRRETSIVAFREHGALDKSLPLDRTRANEITPEFGNALASEVQWQFLPINFQQDMCDHHSIFRAEQILPFIKEEHIASGGFGDVFKMTVLFSQQEFYHDTGMDPVIIRKRLKPKPRVSEGSTVAERPYQEEITCLRLLHRLQHPNIVKLLGSYTFNGEHNFLFPCLDMDLSDFFRLEDRTEDFGCDFTFFAALHGLASALENVHVLELSTEEHGVKLASIGYHHDLRPENVLVSGESFLLADFGLAKLKDKSVPSQTDWKAGAGDYIAPECMGRDFKHRRVGRAIDVWAFGCLIAELATYMELGRTGLEDFQRRRISAEFLDNWEEQYFFSRSGLKPAVARWLQELAHSPKTDLLAELVQLASSILQRDPVERPSAAQIRKKLCLLSVKAHFLAVQKGFADYFRRVYDQAESGPPLMKIWFERERFNAFGVVFGLARESTLDSPILQEVGDLHSQSRALFVSLFHTLYIQSQPEDIDSARNTMDLGLNFDEKVQGLVQALWNLFPMKYQKRMETVWRQTTLDFENNGRLENTRIGSRAAGYAEYDEIRALATMRALRLQFLHISTEEASSRYILNADDVIVEGRIGGHSFGVYQHRRRVLIERVCYSAKWEGIPMEKRAALMTLKAEGLGVTPKPTELRILECLGLMEPASGESGFDFLYAFPGDQNETGHLLRPTTLLELLIRDMREKNMGRQPLLRYKFQLASRLASCLKELHTIGWLHENINSNNIIFFKIDADVIPIPAESFQEPYLVDFRQSRPDGDAWYTEGPSDEEDLDDYRHPTYSRGSRFKLMYDYYSFGIVLLEIGLWNPLSYLTAKHPTATPEQLQDIFIETYVPRLGPRMGEIYQNVVMACLKGEFGEIGETATSKAFMLFLEKVVEPLDELTRQNV